MARKSFTKFQQTETLGNQDYKCNLCKNPFKKSIHPHFDHKNGDNSDNSTENCQALCANCHDEKSRKENVQRSVQKKDQKFVKHCPLCGCEYEKPPNANHAFKCGDCESQLKVLRLDTKIGQKKIAGKKLDIIKHCAHCGVEFDDKASSNKYFKCDECKAIYGIFIKEYKKRGWF